MSLDGLTLRLLAIELQECLIGARIDKIFQPTREEIILSLRSRHDSHKLILSARSAAARVHLTDYIVENPKQPPMFCMLMRKHLCGARLLQIRQNGFERVLLFDFETTNELGDTVTLTLAAEIMGRYSNLVLVGADGKIVDSVKRIDIEKSELRQLLPGLPYLVPPPLQRIPATVGGQAVCHAMKQKGREQDPAKTLAETLEGASPLLCRELIFLACRGEQPLHNRLTDEQYTRLEKQIDVLADIITNNRPQPTVLVVDEIPKDFSFIPILQYQNAAKTQAFPSLSLMLDAFYGEREATERMKQRMQDLTRVVTTRIERQQRKLCAQKTDLLQCADRETLRIKGDMLSSNLYLLQKGMSGIRLPNLYDPALSELDIKLDPMLTPVENIRRYYKEYRKADTAERMLKGLIADGERDLSYLDSIADAMTRAKTDGELTAIRSELVLLGYHVKQTHESKKAKPESFNPLQYRSTDGLLILCGRNNLQNDRLTLKESRKDDMWFHVQGMAGAHTIVVTDGCELNERTIEEAAAIAAVNSKAAKSNKVSVDYTFVRNVRRQPGGKPGMVFYDKFKTVVVSPDAQAVSRLLQENVSEMQHRVK